jgi:hypothetical protein
VLTISKNGDIVQIAQNVLFVLKSFFEKQNRTLNDESGRRSFVLRKGEIRNAFSEKRVLFERKTEFAKAGTAFVQIF